MCFGPEASAVSRGMLFFGAAFGAGVALGARFLVAAGLGMVQSVESPCRTSDSGAIGWP